MQLKPFTFLTLEEVKDWLKIKPADTSADLTLTRIINTATSMVEKYIDGPVLTREFIEERDGNSSDVVVPTYFPVRSVEEIRIDFNRGFGDSTKLDPTVYVLRGNPTLNQASASNPSVEIHGSDIILRDDNNTALLGRIFSGSVVQSIKLTYTAGWGDSADTLPDDLVQATLMLVEYLYIIRENRDLGILMRTSNGQMYRRDKGKGIATLPDEVTLLLDKYVDYSLGIADVPQKNTFTL